MSIAGVGLATVTALLGVIFGLRYRIDDGIKNLKDSMNVELRLAYGKLADHSTREIAVSRDLEDLARRMALTHCKCHDDLGLVARAERSAGWFVPVVVFCAAVGYASAAAAAYALADASLTIRIVVGLAVPFLAFVLEMAYINLLVRNDKHIREAAGGYERAEI
jgi:hypothetical protein